MFVYWMTWSQYDVTEYSLQRKVNLIVLFLNSILLVANFLNYNVFKGIKLVCCCFHSLRKCIPIWEKNIVELHFLNWIGCGFSSFSFSSFLLLIFWRNFLSFLQCCKAAQFCYHSSSLKQVGDSSFKKDFPFEKIKCVLWFQDSDFQVKSCQFKNNLFNSNHSYNFMKIC